MNKKSILKAFNFRSAIREFKENKKISKEDFNFILEAARLSPSSFGAEPWKFLIVQDMNLREKIKNFSSGVRKQTLSASHFVLILARTIKCIKYDSEYLFNLIKDVHKIPKEKCKTKLKLIENFQKEDFKLLENEKFLFEWSCRSTYIPLANMMTAAALIGIDSCPIEGFNREKINELLKSDFKINTDELKISVMVAFGYRKSESPPKTRQSLDEIVKWY